MPVVGGSRHDSLVSDRSASLVAYLMLWHAAGGHQKILRAAPRFQLGGKPPDRVSKTPSEVAALPDRKARGSCPPSS